MSRVAGLLEDELAGTCGEHCDVSLPALAEHVAARDGRGGPGWVDAVVHVPASWRTPRGRSWSLRDRRRCVT